MGASRAAWPLAHHPPESGQVDSVLFRSSLFSSEPVSWGQSSSTCEVTCSGDYKDTHLPGAQKGKGTAALPAGNQLCGTASARLATWSWTRWPSDREVRRPPPSGHLPPLGGLPPDLPADPGEMGGKRASTEKGKTYNAFYYAILGRNCVRNSILFYFFFSFLFYTEV